MRRNLFIALVCLAFCGCEWLKNLGPSPDVAPVMGDPPPRVNIAGRSTGTNRPDGENRFRGNSGDIRPVAGETGDDRDAELTGAEIVATVNGTPILAADLLERYRPAFEQAKLEGATAKDLRDIRASIIRRDLPVHVERTLLVNAMKASLPKKNLDKLDEIIDGVFRQEIERLKKEMKVDTKFQVEQKLQEQGTSLANLRDTFANEQMAIQYFQEKAKKKKILIGRPQLLQYYNQHLADYKVPAKVRWQEIQVSYDKHGGKSDADRVLALAVDDLKKQQDFAAVAKKYSDGLTADKGGEWDWTESGSLADEKIEQALFNAPLGEINLFEGEDAKRLIRVTERRAEHFTSFEDVQKDIEKTLKKEHGRTAAKKVIDDLMQYAAITTIFDDDPEFQPRWRKLPARNVAGAQ